LSKAKRTAAKEIVKEGKISSGERDSIKARCIFFVCALLFFCLWLTDRDSERTFLILEVLKNIAYMIGCSVE
jgi:hypothetical protein